VFESSEVNPGRQSEGAGREVGGDEELDLKETLREVQVFGEL